MLTFYRFTQQSKCQLQEDIITHVAFLAFAADNPLKYDRLWKAAGKFIAGVSFDLLQERNP